MPNSETGVGNTHSSVTHATVTPASVTDCSVTARLSAASLVRPVTAAAVRLWTAGWTVYPGVYTRTYTRGYIPGHIPGVYIGRIPTYPRGVHREDTHLPTGVLGHTRHIQGVPWETSAQRGTSSPLGLRRNLCAKRASLPLGLRRNLCAKRPPLPCYSLKTGYNLEEGSLPLLLLFPFHCWSCSQGLSVAGLKAGLGWVSLLVTES